MKSSTAPHTNLHQRHLKPFLLFPYSCLQYPVLMQFCFKLFTILDKKWEGNELRCFEKRGVTLLQNSTLAFSSLWLICNLQSLFSLSFREVRECLKLDQDHKDCFPFYKVKQHFPSLCQIDLTLTIPAPFQELKLLFGIHPSTPNSNGDVMPPHNINLKLKETGDEKEENHLGDTSLENTAWLAWASIQDSSIGRPARESFGELVSHTALH